MVCGISLRRKRVAVFLCGGTFRALVLRGAARKKEKLSGNSNSTGSYTGCPTRLHPTSISCCEDTWYSWRSSFPNSFSLSSQFLVSREFSPVDTCQKCSKSGGPSCQDDTSRSIRNFHARLVMNDTTPVPPRLTSFTQKSFFFFFLSPRPCTWHHFSSPAHT